jgi:hypothetical protein
MIGYIDKLIELDCNSEAPLFHVLLVFVSRFAFLTQTFRTALMTPIIRPTCKSSRCRHINANGSFRYFAET